MRDRLKIVVTGDVDSGKSTLIGRFLYEAGALPVDAVEEAGDFAYLLDSLQEERQGQLTIDTTQAFCKGMHGAELVFIDVPGHLELLKNMLCGSSYADMAVLVVDVQKPIEPQTKRHAFILKFLGIQRLVLALNKMDLTGYDEAVYNRIKDGLTEFFRQMQLQPEAYIPVSAIQGDNLRTLSKKTAWYEGPSLGRALRAGRIKRKNGSFRFLVQDIYTVREEKVAAGKIISGRLKKGERVIILPLNKECRVKAIRPFGLVLDDMDVIRRSHVICKPPAPGVYRIFSAKIFCVRRIEINAPLRLRCLTQETIARVSEVAEITDIADVESHPDKVVLPQTHAAVVTIALEDSVVLERYVGANSLGRFVLKNDSGEICAIGVVL